MSLDLLKFDNQIYVHKLNANELGYRNGKPRGAGRFILVSKSCIGYFPPLSEVVLNDHIFIDVIPPFSDDVVLTNYIYHNSKYATSEKGETRDEYRIYLNSGNDINRDYYKPDDMVLFVKIYKEQDIIYKVLYLKASSDNYARVKKILEIVDRTHKSNALIAVKELAFIDDLRKIRVGSKVIPEEIIKLAFEEKISHVPTAEDRVEATRVMRSRSFRDLVLYFYDYRCAITGKELFIDHKDLNNLEAAHILARSGGGGSHPANGIALERNLHWAFDKGFFTINFDGKEYRVETHKEALRVPYLAKINKNKLFVPEDSRSRPNIESLEWHKQNIFGIFLKTEI